MNLFLLEFVDFLNISLVQGTTKKRPKKGVKMYLIDFKW